MELPENVKSLSKGQIAGVLAGALAALALVFVLGVYHGKQLTLTSEAAHRQAVQCVAVDPVTADAPDARLPDAEVVAPPPAPRQELVRPDGAKEILCVQVASFTTRAEAERLVTQLKAKRVGARISKAEVNGKEYFRVRLSESWPRETAEERRAAVSAKAEKAAILVRCE